MPPLASVKHFDVVKHGVGELNTGRDVTQDQISSVIQQQVVRKRFKANDVCDVVELLLDERSESIYRRVIHVGGV